MTQRSLKLAQVPMSVCSRREFGIQFHLSSAEDEWRELMRHWLACCLESRMLKVQRGTSVTTPGHSDQREET
uniref:Uncharacterized protein n=1 Tax=Setaria digitata TaxID=48799 RepID=A0A915Q3T5_9BILA